MTRPDVQGLHPHLFVPDARAAAAFYRRAFGAVEVFSNALPDGRVLFAELAVGPARLLLSEPFDDLLAVAPAAGAPLPFVLAVEVADPDEVVRRAVLLGAEVEQPVAEQFWGERYGIVRDPFGFRWSVSTVRQELTAEEMRRRTPGAGDGGEAPGSR